LAKLFNWNRPALNCQEEILVTKYVDTSARAGVHGGMNTSLAMITLFLVMDPLGNIPVFLTILRPFEARRRSRILLRELLLAFGILLSFLIGGKWMLAVLHLRQESISIAGGIILFLIALRMIFPHKGGIMGEFEEGEPFLVPLAVPLIAGPSTIATLLLFASSYPERLLDWTLALTAAWAMSAGILLLSGLLYNVLKERGLAAIERLMGMLLVTLAVQMFLDGIAAYFGSGR
jgi:multiple antibiotic resistance protein